MFRNNTTAPTVSRVVGHIDPARRVAQADLTKRTWIGAAGLIRAGTPTRQAQSTI